VEFGDDVESYIIAVVTAIVHQSMTYKEKLLSIGRGGKGKKENF
jgi:hypothetical protein